MTSRLEPVSASYFEKFESPNYRFKTETTAAPQNGSSLASEIPESSWKYFYREYSLESDMDEVASEIKNPFTLEEFRGLWQELRPDLAGIVSTSKATTCEDLINDIAKHLFPRSKLFRKVEEELFKGKQFKTTKETKDWLEETAALYVRLAKRWNQMYGITNGRLIYTALVCLPPIVRLVLELEDCHLWTVDNLLERAQEVESRIRDIEGKLPEWK